jgi:hypothetical protein
MDPETEELETPELVAVEDRLARNYGEFDALRDEWGRAWQRALNRRCARRARERADAQKRSDTQQPLDAA